MVESVEASQRLQESAVIYFGYLYLERGAYSFHGILPLPPSLHRGGELSKSQPHAESCVYLHGMVELSSEFLIDMLRA